MKEGILYEKIISIAVVLSLMLSLIPMQVSMNLILLVGE